MWIMVIDNTNNHPFVWVVPDSKSPALPGHDHGDGSQINGHNDRTGDDGRDNPFRPVGLNPTMLEDSGDDDPFGINGYLEMDGSIRDDDPTPGDHHNGVSTGTHGGESSRLRESDLRPVKRELRDVIHNPKIGDKAITRKIQLLECKKKMRIPFTPKIPKILDFLSRWSLGTTSQLARIAGWRDSNDRRLRKKFRLYAEVGFMRETDIYGGPKIWTATNRGAKFGLHPWLGGVSEINPMSLGHLFGLASIASWLLCPWDTTPNILGLPSSEWNQVRGEIRDGTARLLAEKEVRSSYSSIRNSCRGVIPPEYRHGFIGYSGGGLVNPVHGAWREWALAYKNGDATLDESPELLACDPGSMGSRLWLWVVWGNSVWNPKVLEDRACLEEGIDLDDPEWSGRAGELRLRSGYRQYGFVPVEERLDYATNRPVINKALGDRFALWDHIPDLIIARKRDSRTGVSQSIAIELELTAKPTPDAYARTMAAYGSPLGQTLFAKVIWLVPSKTIADRIRAGANKVGMILGEDYDIVPFVTSNKVTRIRKSFYTGADLLPGKWSRSGRIEPCEFDRRSIPLS